MTLFFIGLFLNSHKGSSVGGLEDLDTGIRDDRDSHLKKDRFRLGRCLQDLVR